MSSYRHIPPYQILNQVVNATVLSLPLKIATLSVTSFLISIGAGTLNATFQMMVSMDGVNYYDSGQVIDPATGPAAVIPVNPPPQAFPFVLIKITVASGSANVTITGAAKT